MDEEEESYMAISESSEGYLSVEYFLYRVYNVEGTARASGEGKIYCLKIQRHRSELMMLKVRWIKVSKAA